MELLLSGQFTTIFEGFFRGFSKKQKACFERTSLSSISGCHCTLSQHGKGVCVDVSTYMCLF